MIYKPDSIGSVLSQLTCERINLAREDAPCGVLYSVSQVDLLSHHNVLIAKHANVEWIKWKILYYECIP